MTSSDRRRNYNVPITYPQLQDREWLYQRYVVEDRGPKAIAAELGCTTAAVLRALGFAGIKLKERRPYKRAWEPTREELIAAYLEAGSLDELAERRGLSKATIRNIFARCGIRPMDIALPWEPFKAHPQLADKEWLARELDEKPIRQVAQEIGAAQATVAKAMNYHGITTEREAKRSELHERAVKLYLAGNTLHVVSRIVRRDQAQVFRWLRAAGVDTTIRTSRNKRR